MNKIKEFIKPVNFFSGRFINLPGRINGDVMISNHKQEEQYTNNIAEDCKLNVGNLKKLIKFLFNVKIENFLAFGGFPNSSEGVFS